MSIQSFQARAQRRFPPPPPDPVFAQALAADVLALHADGSPDWAAWSPACRTAWARLIMRVASERNVTIPPVAQPWVTYWAQGGMHG